MKYYSANGQRITMRTNSVLTWLLGDHLPLQGASRGSTTITANADGTLASGQTYTACPLRGCSAALREGTTRSGSVSTDRQYTLRVQAGQISESQLGIYFYNARYYDPYLAQFTQPDSIIPNPFNPIDHNRYAYCGYNPILYLDPDGHEKIVIIDGNNDTNSFEAAARTKYREALEQGYTEDEIYMVQANTEDEFFAAIEHNDNGEIEELYIFSHGWGIDTDGTPEGGLQLTKIEGDELYDLTESDLSSEYSSRFNEGAEVYINACSTAQGSFPQEIANNYGVTVYAYDKEMKFFTFYSNPFEGIFVPFFYTGDSEEPSESTNVYMMPVVKRVFLWPFGPIEFKPENENSTAQ